MVFVSEAYESWEAFFLKRAADVIPDVNIERDGVVVTYAHNAMIRTD